MAPVSLRISSAKSFNEISSGLSGQAIGSRYGLIPQEGMEGHGLIGGRRGIRRMGGALGKTEVGPRNQLIHMMPPALVSQPLSANFQMARFLPPQYQKYNDGPGMIIGSGLGTGLGTGLGVGLYTH